MKTTLQIKLLPSPEQHQALVETMAAFNDACTWIAAYAFEQRGKQHNWGFRQLRDFIVYKAKLVGVPVVLVDPRNTSRTCNRCGFVSKRTRKSQAEFSCIRCGHQAHADLNAAKNLVVRGSVSAPDLIASASGPLALAWQ